MGNVVRIACITLVVATCAGCASTPEPAGAEASAAPLVESQDGRKIPLSRSVSGIGHLSWVYARSVYEDPINRPVSQFASLASLALKSTGGLFRRIAIGTTQMPALNGPIPALSYGRRMDLEDFEKTLDRITGTRPDTGRISFLIDGDDYFGRLVETINSAQHSIDIRTYIFDNDDFAVEMAVLLKERAKDVRVRVLLDGLGNALARRVDPDSLPDDDDHPLMMNNYIKRNSAVRVRALTNPWFTGDHTKTTIIDRKIAFVGGMNVGREYRYDWHDMMMHEKVRRSRRLPGSHPSNQEFRLADSQSADRGDSQRTKLHPDRERLPLGRPHRLRTCQSAAPRRGCPRNLSIAWQSRPAECQQQDHDQQAARARRSCIPVPGDDPHQSVGV